MLAGVEPVTGGLDTDQFDARLWNVGIENTHGVRATTDAGDHRTASVQRVLNDANYAAELKQKGIERTKFFSWDEIAKKTAEVYESMLYAV
jgi:hypothetical protein